MSRKTVIEGARALGELIRGGRLEELGGSGIVEHTALTLHVEGHTFIRLVFVGSSLIKLHNTLCVNLEPVFNPSTNLSFNHYFHCSLLLTTVAFCLDFCMLPFSFP